MDLAGRILLVDDDPQGLESTRKILELAGYEVLTAQDGQAALDLARPQRDRVPFDLILTDVRMPRLGGLEFLRALSLWGETTPVILMTAYGRVEDAVWAMKLGAVDFLTKPFKRQALLTSLETALKRVKSRGVSNHAAAGSDSLPYAGLIGRSAPIQKLKETLAQVARTQVTILITGESGTGKELVARSIHQQSVRATAKFIALNCAAFPENLIESELFGFEKGAFTGATASKEGLLEAAHGGTLLLDEIGDMPISLQANLLRTLQESEVRRIGATASKKVDVRIIAATHRDLREGVRLGSFRQDLLYRLEVVNIHMPPLRERMDDLPELAHYFLKSFGQRHGKAITGIESGALEVMLLHTWPGNIRELANVIERAVVFAEGEEIRIQDLPPHLSVLAEKRERALCSASVGKIEVPLGTSLREVEEIMIRKTLEATDGDKNMTARILGVNSRTIYRKLDKKLD